ncbi:MAG: hypothetical protein QF793_04230 [Candidatus Peribacteraceae bacterium]|jgi:hypothetical protein|nr:hypothetical protein [bacterium]MDP6562102.1 hypothetical protein [Candidatus Peribacteraceae bacterium]|tara:strand:- start:4502 stop:4834 length:333 start_codon:yes stop_codon:yes gene_type:complete
MKNVIFALTAFALLLGISSTIPAAEAAPYRYSVRDADGWPMWIGRLKGIEFSKCGDGTDCHINRLRPEMAAKYLPLSLIKTGRFAEILEEVENTPNVDTRVWPSWIGELK